MPGHEISPRCTETHANDGTIGSAVIGTGQQQVGARGTGVHISRVPVEGRVRDDVV
jgi:hypothetical protein